MAITLVVEDGTGKVDANTFISLADADAYHAERFSEGWKGDDELRKSALIQATSYICNEFVFQGDKAFPETPQALCWPRYGIYDEDAFLIDQASIPTAIAHATAELALVVLCHGELLPTISVAAVKRRRERVGVIESEQEFDADESTLFFPRVHQLLAPYLTGRRLGGGSSPLMRG